MSSFSSGGGGDSRTTSQAHVGEQTARLRESYITNKKGDAVGNNYLVPKSDFSSVLGYQRGKDDPSKDATSGANVLGEALAKRFQQLGLKASEMGNEGRNMFIAQGALDNKHGRTADQIKDGLDSVRQAMHPNAEQAPRGSDKEVSVAAIKNGQPVMGGSAMDQYFAKMEASQAKTRNENDRMLAIQMKLQNMSKQDSTISNLMKTRHDAVSRVIRGGGQ